MSAPRRTYKPDSAPTEGAPQPDNAPWWPVLPVPFDGRDWWGCRLPTKHQGRLLCGTWWNNDRCWSLRLWLSDGALVHLLRTLCGGDLTEYAKVRIRSNNLGKALHARQIGPGVLMSNSAWDAPVDQARLDRSVRGLETLRQATGCGSWSIAQSMQSPSTLATVAESGMAPPGIADSYRRIHPAAQVAKTEAEREAAGAAAFGA